MKFPKTFAKIFEELVTPYAGVWIEISSFTMRVMSSGSSLPTRECGLKFQNSREPNRYQVTPYAGVWIEMMIVELKKDTTTVTPYAGVWIEICQTEGISAEPTVTPYAGVWIEILEKEIVITESESLPTRECGLKYT